jgi:hypothetical protein
LLFRYLYERELTGNFGFLVYATALPGRRNSVPRHVRTTLLQDERARRRTSVVERHAPPRNDVLVLLPPRRRRRQRPRRRSPGSRGEGQAARALVARRLRPIPARVRGGIVPEIRARGDILRHQRRCLDAVLRPPPAPPPPRARGGARPTAAIPIVPPTAIVFAFNSSSTSLAAIEAVCNSAAALFSGLFRAAQVLRRQTPNPEMLYSHCWVILQTWTCRSNYCNMPQSPYLLVFCAGQRKNSPWLQCVFIVHTS